MKLFISSNPQHYTIFSNFMTNITFMHSRTSDLHHDFSITEELDSCIWFVAAEEIFSWDAHQALSFIKKILNGTSRTENFSVLLIAMYAKEMSPSYNSITSFSYFASNLAIDKVRANVLNCSWIKEWGEYSQYKSKYQLLGDITATDMINAAMFLLSSDSRWIAGSTLTVDSGISTINI